MKTLIFLFFAASFFLFGSAFAQEGDSNIHQSLVANNLPSSVRAYLEEHENQAVVVEGSRVEINGNTVSQQSQATIGVERMESDRPLRLEAEQEAPDD